MTRTPFSNDNLLFNRPSPCRSAYGNNDNTTSFAASLLLRLQLRLPLATSFFRSAFLSPVIRLISLETPFLAVYSSAYHAITPDLRRSKPASCCLPCNYRHYCFFAFAAAVSLPATVVWPAFSRRHPLLRLRTPIAEERARRQDGTRAIWIEWEARCRDYTYGRGT